MTEILILMVIQGLLGAFDNLWHHEIKEALPSRPDARHELALHTVREFLYGIIFLVTAWFAWNGIWAVVLIALLAIEVMVTLADFVIEDKTRLLPPLERVTHAILAINFGAIIALWSPLMVVWYGHATGFAPVHYGVFSWILTAYGIVVLMWAVRNAVATWRLYRPEWERAPIRAGQNDHPRAILITGATGFIGRSLTRSLIERGDRVMVLTRNHHKAFHMFGRHVEIVTDLADIADDRRIDGIVNLAGAPVMGGLWTAARRKTLIESRVHVTKDLVRLIARLDHKPEVMISGSAVGFYGSRGTSFMTERDGPQPIYMSELCQAWEAAAGPVAGDGVRLCLLRTGLVLGNDGGSLAPLALSVRLGAGMVLGHGKQFMPWILKSDLVRMIHFLIDRQDVSGPVNATAPMPVTNRHFMHTLGYASRRPVFLRLPGWCLRLPLGELADLFLTGQRALPEKMHAAGFRFVAPTLRRALRKLRRDRQKVNWPRFGGEALHVFYNDSCPVCATEMDHYADLAGHSGAAIDFHRLSADAQALASYGLTPADAVRRLYLIDNAGRIWGGVDAVAAIWAALPRYRYLARLLRTRPGHLLGELLYDGMVAPLLCRWNQRRGRRPKRRLVHH